MTTIRHIIELSAPAPKVWDIVRDVGAVHTRFAPGFVVDTQLESGSRVVTFANGHVVRERIVGIDEQLQRLAYSVIADGVDHHNASFEVIPLSASHTRLVWTADVLPEAAAEVIRPMMAQGSKVISTTLVKLG